MNTLSYFLSKLGCYGEERGDQYSIGCNRCSYFYTSICMKAMDKVSTAKIRAFIVASHAVHLALDHSQDNEQSNYEKVKQRLAKRVIRV